MASTLTPKKATPYSLAYELVSDGSNITRPIATMINDCSPGPLRALLVKLNAVNRLSSLNLDATGPGLESLGRVRIRPVEGIAGAQGGPATQSIAWTAPGLSCTAAAGTSQIELRLEHSYDR